MAKVQLILFVTNKDNFRIFTSQGLLGFKKSRKSEAGKTKPGDKLICYVGGEKKIGGILKIESEMFEDKKKIFAEKTPGEIYPWRFKVSTVVSLPEEKQLPIEYFFDKLEMFERYSSKYLALQGQVHPLSAHDFNLLEDEILKALAPRPQKIDQF